MWSRLELCAQLFPDNLTCGMMSTQESFDDLRTKLSAWRLWCPVLRAYVLSFLQSFHLSSIVPFVTNFLICTLHCVGLSTPEDLMLFPASSIICCLIDLSCQSGLQAERRKNLPQSGASTLVRLYTLWICLQTWNRFLLHNMMQIQSCK